MDSCPPSLTAKPPLSNLQDRIARVYYSHGLFCSSHPYSVIVTTLIVLSICCYPLLQLPLLGSSSQHFTTPVLGFVAPELNPEKNDYPYTTPRWFIGPPVGYIQQIVLKIAVSPWKADLILTDAFRAPLAEAFHIRELVNNHQTTKNRNRSTTLNDICFQVSESVDKVASPLLPHFQCLLVSPTNVWNHDLNLFQEDVDITKTVFSLRDSRGDSSSIREVLFGIPWKETGLKQFNIRSRPRVLTYAFTIIFQTFDSDFLQSLEALLKLKYHSNPYLENTTYRLEEGLISHIFFQDLHACAEFIPLGVAYTILFLYIYFSVRKIELVKSKWALAISAVMTVMMSLFMSVGLCVWFGLNPTLNGSEILPYLIVVIGLENMLVLTKSVVSTPVHLDVKLRVAQGLSKEGWSITKNLLTELALLTVAFLTFVPKIQEFCLFAVVGLLTDFFLQLVFFATFLSLDIRRIEISDLHRNQHRKILYDRGKSALSREHDRTREMCKKKLVHSPTKTAMDPYTVSNAPAKVFAPSSNPMLGELPKRMKFIYFWARTRIVQRGLMVCLVVWIFFWAYSSSIVEKFSDGTLGLSTFYDLVGVSNSSVSDSSLNDAFKVPGHLSIEYANNLWSRLKHQNLFLWQSLTPHHWPTLFGYYNISLSGRYISIVPPIHLSVAVDAKVASEMRTAADVITSKKSHWQFLPSAETADKDVDDQLSSDIPYHPSSPAEAGLAIALAIPTVLFFTYLMVVLYRCMCTRHYAEWRSSWKNSSQSSLDSRRGSNMSTSGCEQYLITETLPIKLHAHSQEVETIVCDDCTIVSVCLHGDICIWDKVSGECLTTIKRSRLKRKSRCDIHVESDSFSSNSPSCSSSPVSSETEPMHVLNPLFRNLDTQVAHESEFNEIRTDEIACEKEWYSTKSQKYDFSAYVTRSASQIENKGVAQSDTQTERYANIKKNLGKQDSEDARHSLFYSTLSFEAIWCLDYWNSFIAVGCKDGRLEVWNAFSGNLEYVYDDYKCGITALSINEDRIVAARLNGLIDFFSVDIIREDFISCRCEDHKTEIYRNHSAIRCVWLQNAKAHTLSVSALELDSSFIVSGGFDRLVKVFKCDSLANVYTLHGHSSPISALHIDKYVSASATSGCEEGLICLWDLLTGTCMYSVKGHQGEVMVLKLTAIYMISEGTDNRICIWEKFQGHLLHCITQDYCLHSDFALLTHNIMVTAKEDNLLLWDVNHGEALRMIMVGNGDHSRHIKQLRLSGQSIVCDYGAQMFIVSFPALAEKLD